MHSNPLGYPDHRPFLGFSDELVFGLGPDGAVRHISEVARGLKCDCRCPACDRRLVARKGTRKVHHFGHHDAGQPCAHVAETNAHLWAKRVLEREKRIVIPPVMIDHEGQAFEVSPARVYAFASARLEKRLDSIVPDVILETKDGTQLIIEVCVTHPCDEVKIEKLRTEDRSAIEVNLRRFRTSQDREAIEAALLSEGPRDWLHNARIPFLADKLRRTIEAETERREAAAEERARQDAARQAAKERREEEDLARALDQIVRAVRVAHGEARQAEAGRAGDRHANAPRVPLRAMGFRVVDSVWQSELAGRYLSAPDALDFEEDLITVESAMRWVSEHILPEFQAQPPPKLRERLASRFPRVSTPCEAIELFFEYAVGEGYLTQVHEGFLLDKDYARSLRREAAERIACEYRRSRLSARVAELVARLPQGERVPFDLDRWMQSPIGGLGLSPERLCRSEFDEAFRSLEHDLSLVDALFVDDEVPGKLLGLPLAQEVERARVRRTDAQLRQAAERRQSLSKAAAQDLGEAADAWLCARCEMDEEVSRIDYAGFDDCALRAMTQALWKAARKREVALEKAERARTQLKELRLGASRVLPPDHAELFIRAHHPALGKSPSEHCIQGGSAQDCLVLLKVKQRGRPGRR